MWKDLSIKNKAELMRLYIENGITDLEEVRKHYDNLYAEGGPLGPDSLIKLVKQGKYYNAWQYDRNVRDAYNTVSQNMQSQNNQITVPEIQKAASNYGYSQEVIDDFTYPMGSLKPVTVKAPHPLKEFMGYSTADWNNINIQMNRDKMYQNVLARKEAGKEYLKNIGIVGGYMLPMLSGNPGVLAAEGALALGFTPGMFGMEKTPIEAGIDWVVNKAMNVDEHPERMQRAGITSAGLGILAGLINPKSIGKNLLRRSGNIKNAILHRDTILNKRLLGDKPIDTIKTIGFKNSLKMLDPRYKTYFHGTPHVEEGLDIKDFWTATSKDSGIHATTSLPVARKFAKDNGDIYMFQIPRNQQYWKNKFSMPVNDYHANGIDMLNPSDITINLGEVNPQNKHINIKNADLRFSDYYGTLKDRNGNYGRVSYNISPLDDLSRVVERSKRNSFKQEASSLYKEFLDSGLSGYNPNSIVDRDLYPGYKMFNQKTTDLLNKYGVDSYVYQNSSGYEGFGNALSIMNPNIIKPIGVYPSSAFKSSKNMEVYNKALFKAYGGPLNS